MCYIYPERKSPGAIGKERPHELSAAALVANGIFSIKEVLKKGFPEPFEQNFFTPPLLEQRSTAHLLSMNLFLSKSTRPTPRPQPIPVPSQSRLEKACQIAAARTAAAREMDAEMDDMAMQDADDALTDDESGTHGELEKPHDRADAGSDTEDEGDDQGDDDDDDDDNIPAVCDTYAFGHDTQAPRDLPVNWPIYEVYCLNVPTTCLKANTMGEPTTWGQFADDTFSKATKRLLYLLFQTVERSLKAPPCDPLRDLCDPNAAPHTKEAHERRMAQELQDANPQGLVTRPPGIGGARPSDDDLSLSALVELLTPFRPRDRTTAQSASEQNVFVFAKGSEGEECDDAADSTTTTTTTQSSRPVLVRRISLRLEELLTETGGVTTGWRWWVLVHDPRIQLARWMSRVIQENKALFDFRQRLRDTATNAGRSNPRLQEPIDRFDSPHCHRAIRSMSHYVSAVRAYYRGTRGNAARACGLDCPRRDAEAVQHNITGSRTSLHPCRVFSPVVAMDLHVQDYACLSQCNIQRYVSAQSRRLGSVVRPARTRVFNPLRMDVARLHNQSLPAATHRAAVIHQLKWKSLEDRADELPPSMSQAVADKNMEVVMRIAEGLAPADFQKVQGLMRSAVTEANIEAAEDNLWRAQREESGGPPSKRRRYREPSLFGTDDQDDVLFEDPLSSPMRFEDDDGGGDDGGDADEAGLLSDATRMGEACGDVTYDPEQEVNLAMFEHLRQIEEMGASLSETDVQRSPLLHQRMVNHQTRANIENTYQVDTPQYRTAMNCFRQRSLEVFWNTLQTYKTDKTRLSGPVRGALKFLENLNKNPNRIRRHHAAVYGEHPEARAQGRRAARRRQEQGELFMSMMSQTPQGHPQPQQPAPEQPPAAAAWSGDRGARRGERGLPDAWKRPPPSSTVWHEWPFGGGWNLTAYGSWRVTMHHRCVHFFQCCPGHGPCLLHRLLLAQGTAWTYLWGLHGDQLLCGPGGAGKSHKLLCVYKQSFPGQVVVMDHLTERCFATDDDWNDVLIIIEEVHPRFVGQDEKGNVVAGDELLKTLMTRHCINTVQIHNTDDGRRIRVMATARAMLTLFGATNLTIRMHLDGHLPAILRRWMMDYVGWGQQKVPLAEINNQMSFERSTPEQAAFFHQLAVTNALCLLIEKLIEAKVLDDICTDICSFHFPWFFDQVHRQCGVPKASGSIREMLIQLCRQTCLRYAVHKVFFSETAADTVRCRPRTGVAGNGAELGPKDWEARPFDPFMLLEVQPHLVVTEEMMVDVLTTTRSTYIPTTRWGALDVILEIYKQGSHRFRRRTRKQIRAHQDRATRRRGNDDDDGDDIMDTDVVMQEAEAAEQAPDEAEDDPFDCLAGAALADPPPAPASAPPAPASSASVDSGLEYMDDRNYFAIVGSSLLEVCDLLAQECHRSITSGTFLTELKGLHKEWMVHKDRNRPKQRPDGSILLNRQGEPVYKKKIKSPIVVWETLPDETAGSVLHRSQSRERSEYQVCILIEYLERERNTSLNEILRKGLSYQGARARQIVTADGVRDVFPVKNMLHTRSDTHATLHGGDAADEEDDDDDDDDDQQKHVVVREYLGVIDIKPTHGRHLSRVNHFSESMVTDSLVFNSRMDAAGKEPPDWGDNRYDPNRQAQIFLHHDMNQMVIDEYWCRAGLKVDPAKYPWNYTKELKDLVARRKDRTGTPTSNRVQEHYPDSYRMPDTTSLLHRQQTVYNRNARARRPPRSLAALAIDEDEDEQDTTTTTTSSPRGEVPFSGRDVFSWMRSQRKRKRGY